MSGPAKNDRPQIIVKEMMQIVRYAKASIEAVSDRNCGRRK